VTAASDPAGSRRVPDWLKPLVGAARAVRPEQLSHFLPPAHGGRASAVLILFGGADWEQADVLLIERAHDMRSHAGQVAFPGGAIDADDVDAVAAALREAVEETGLDPNGVDILGTLPALFLPVTDYVVTPVLAWWREPSPVSVVDPREVASVHRVPVAELLDPSHRFRIRHPSGYLGPAFEVAGLLVWGFTAGLIDQLLRLGGWEQPWDPSVVRDLPPEAVARSMRDAPVAGEELR
jgi:8-oxo-dGTP pyrophosphatase MutT (NUDIX family)